MKKLVGWLIALLVVVGCAVAYWRYRESHKAPEIDYRTVKIEKRRIVAKVTASGTLQATVTVQVGTQVSGRVQKLMADFNSTVKKGELVAKIDPQLFQAAVAQAHANYAQSAAGLVKAQATVRDAELQFNRVKALNAENLASAADLQAADTNLQVAKAGVDVAKASLEQAQASMNQARINLEYTNIYSPIDGTVISRSVDVGQTVAASLSAPTLFTIAEDLRKMQVNTNVAEGDVGRLEPGMGAYFTVDAFPGQRFRGKISQIRNAAQTLQNVVTYDAVIDVDNADLKLRPGMTANVTVIYAQRPDVLAVPNAALRFRPPPEALGSSSAAPSAPGSAASAPTGRTRRGDRDAGAPSADGAPVNDSRTVWVLRNGHAESATIKTGLTDGTVTEIVEGDLKEGDQVITDANVAGKAPAPTGGGGGGGGSSPMRRMF
jgi:HlyD family secretion protein